MNSALRNSVFGTALFVTLTTAANGQTYDLVINNGRVIDPETGFDAIAHVGIVDGEIVEIAQSQLEGEEVIDASGLIVAPGFIDLHSHSVVDLPANRLQAFDGVTTALELESGVLPIADWYASVEAEGRATNFGATASWSFARIATMVPEMPPVEPTAAWYQGAFNYPRWTTNVTTEEELDKIVDLIQQGLDDGALGIGVNSGYVPGVGGKELLRIWELAAENGVPVSTHMRNWSEADPLSSLEGLAMVLGLSATSGARTNICHLHSTNLHDTLKAADMVDKARSIGIDVHTEVYPYGIASMPIASAVLLQAGEAFRARMGIDFDSVRLIAKGRWIEDEADMRAEQDADPGQFIIMRYLDEEDATDADILRKVTALPWIAIASDSIPYTQPDGTPITGQEWPMPDNAFSNPRSAGTYGKFLREWVREDELLDWPEAIAKVSLIPAQLFDGQVPAMERKGRLQEGMDADITVFDPETIGDRATIDRPFETTEGIEYLIVNGTAVISGGEMDTNVLPGQPIRK
ncbi:amidohydrolase family protein [Halocynthiibacter sp. C4]|uniref:amidohydrolase family protein n=1 Tax=Halocynthiibacter sp. C4 TaxID=2992758 RepID=UPI00237C127F|nr:amidohydrolase family protein [Halocynthiibacter sp. C4]MDE0589519.1 amidohydrolase family protein [Halocynthiibacter sp. C4]